MANRLRLLAGSVDYANAAADEFHDCLECALDSGVKPREISELPR